MLIIQEAGYLVGVIAMGSVSNRPNDRLCRLLKKLPLLIMALDSDRPGAVESRRYWGKQFPQSVRIPIPRKYGKDPGEAFHNGLDIRAWVVCALDICNWPLSDVPAHNVSLPSYPQPQPVSCTPLTSGAPHTDQRVEDPVQHMGAVVPQSRTAAFTETQSGAENIAAEADMSCGTGQGDVCPQFAYVVHNDIAKAAVAALMVAPGPFGADVETAKHPDHRAHLKSGLEPRLSRIRLVQIYAPGFPVYIFDMSRINVHILAPLWDRPVIFHNAMFDLKHLLFSGANPTKVGCTMLMENCLSGNLRSLADLAAEYLGLEVSKEQQVSDWNADTLTDEQLSYAALDAYLVHCLYVELRCRLLEEGLEHCYKLMRDAQRALAEMMVAGTGFNADAHSDVVREWEAQRDTARARCLEVFGPDVDLDSPAQVADWFAKHLDQETLVKWPRTKKGRLSTKAEDLAAIGSHPAVLAQTEYKALQTLLSTFGGPYLRHINPVTGRLHGDFRFGASTGRLRCGQPNVQNVPKQKSFRALFVARPGYRLVKADYSQAQLRIIAELSRDAAMLQVFRDGGDIHSLTASAITGKEICQVTKEERAAAKSIVFGFSFGLSANGFRKKARAEYGVDFTSEEARRVRRVFFRSYPGIERYQRQLVARARQTWRVATPGGRIRRFPRKGSEPPYNEVLNTPVQGGEAEIIFSALAMFPDRLAGLDATLVNVVHDEVVFEILDEHLSNAVPIIESVMVDAMLAIFPYASTLNLVDVSVGPDWGNTVKYRPGVAPL
jgi:DNA polymerase I-like protein with 3'-5' exonuclease and polymerase domains